MGEKTPTVPVLLEHSHAALSSSWDVDQFILPVPTDTEFVAGHCQRFHNDHNISVLYHDHPDDRGRRV